MSNNPVNYDNEFTAKSTGTVLELAKTRLRVVSGELQRLNKSGGVMLRLPLHQIEAVEFRSFFDPVCIVFMAMGVGLGAIGYYVSESNILTSLLYVAGVLLFGFGLLGSVSPYFVIRSRGETIYIQFSDLGDEGQGFVSSLRHMIGA
jgi:hypothetical protein